MNRTRRTIITASAIAALALAPALSACGSAAQSAAENAVQSAMGGGNVDISSQGVTVTDPSGNAMAAGSNVPLPSNWPSEVPVPDGGSLGFVSVTADGAATAAWMIPGSFADVAAAYGDKLTGAGYAKQSDTTSADGIVQIYTGNGWTISTSSTTSDGTTTLTVGGSKDS
jgi:hypothetical protein